MDKFEHDALHVTRLATSSAGYVDAKVVARVAAQLRVLYGSKLPALPKVPPLPALPKAPPLPALPALPKVTR